WLAACLVVVVAELLLEHLVVPARPLFLSQLLPVLGRTNPAATMIARRVGTPLDCALVGHAALALEEKLHPLAATLLALRSSISCQTWLLPFFVLSLFLRGSRVPIRYTRRRFRGLQPLCACGVTSFTVMISRP